MLNTLNTISELQTRRPRNAISAILLAPAQIPDAEKVQYVFQTLGYHKCITKVLSDTDTLTVRTNIQSLGVISIALLAEKLSASNVELGFSRGGLILMFKYS